MLNATHSFLSGGKGYEDGDETYLSSAWIYNWQKDEWRSLPDLSNGRFRGFCLTFGNKKLIVLGGVNNAQTIHVSKILLSVFTFLAQNDFTIHLR